MWQYTYYHDGSSRRTIDPAGATTEASYDVLGRQVSSAVTEGHATYWWTTNLAYDDAGHQKTSTSPAPHNYVTTTTYNTAGEPTKVTDHTGRFTRTTYDMAGRVVETVAGKDSTYANPVTTQVWDLAGRAYSTSDCVASPAGSCSSVLRTATTSYDLAGRVLSEMSGQLRPTYYTYDTAGQLTGITQRVTPATPATAITVSLGYDAAGNKTRMVDGNGNATTYTYNAWNLPESVVEPSTTAHPAASDRTWTTAYDAAGRALVETLPGGVTRTSTYDKLGRLTGETGTGATTLSRSLDCDPVRGVRRRSGQVGLRKHGWPRPGRLRVRQAVPERPAG